MSVVALEVVLVMLLLEGRVRTEGRGENLTRGRACARKSERGLESHLGRASFRCSR
jgi:hypothetical protein